MGQSGYGSSVEWRLGVELKCSVLEQSGQVWEGVQCLRGRNWSRTHSRPAQCYHQIKLVFGSTQVAPSSVVLGCCATPAPTHMHCLFPPPLHYTVWSSGVWSGVCEEGERRVVRGRWEGQGAHGRADSWPLLGLEWVWAWPAVAR